MASSPPWQPRWPPRGVPPPSVDDASPGRARQCQKGSASSSAHRPDRARSSGGQSAALIRPRSLVRVQARPPTEGLRTADVGLGASHRLPTSLALSPSLGVVAQLGERRLCTAEVRGSTPRGSTGRAAETIRRDTRWDRHVDKVRRGTPWCPRVATRAPRWVVSPRAPRRTARPGRERSVHT